MKKRQGFTLVELLAVIVILAVILVIAIPNVIKLIDKAKLDTYKRNEDMLVSATQKYMASNGISLNVGETRTITYSDLTSDKLIDKITDQTSKGECSNSKIYVTKTSSGYTYKPGLICDNYISLDTFDLLNGVGNFSKDTNSDGLADGLISTYITNKSLINGVQKYDADTTNIEHYPEITLPTPIANHYYYSSVYAKTYNCKFYSMLVIRLADGNYTANPAIYITSSNDFKQVSYIQSFASIYSTPYFRLRYKLINSSTNSTAFIGSGEGAEIKKAILLDLTDLNLASKSVTEIDDLVNKSR
jgi:type IV pilus assembly protein PilA